MKRLAIYQQGTNLFLTKIFFYPACYSIIFFISRLLNYNGLIGDAHEYLRFSIHLKDVILHGAPVGPFCWPVLFPLMGTLFNFVFPWLPSLIICTLLAGCFTAFYFEKILLKIYPCSLTEARIYTCLFLILSPYMFRMSFTMMSDYPGVFFVMACGYQFFNYMNQPAIKRLLLFTIFAGLAVMTRYACAVILIPWVLKIGYEELKHFSIRRILLTILCLAISIIPYFIFKENDAFTFLKNNSIWVWDLRNFFLNTFETSESNLIYQNINLSYVFMYLFHPGFIFAGALFLLILLFNLKIKQDIKIWVLLPVLIYFLFLAGIPFQNQRYFCLSFPLLLLLFFPGYLYVNSWLKKKEMIPIAVIGSITIQIILIAFALKPFINRTITEKYIATKLTAQRQKTVYSFIMIPSMQSLKVKKKFISLIEDTIKKVETQSLLLIQEENMKSQWKNKLPYYNWKFIQHHASLKLIEKLPESWYLYEVHPDSLK